MPRSSILQSLGGSVLTLALMSQLTPIEVAIQTALLVGSIWFAVTLIVIGSEEPIRIFARYYANYKSREEIEERDRKIVALTRELEIARQEIDDLVNEGIPTGKNAVALLAQRLIVDYYQYGLEMGYGSVQKRKACSRADWDFVHKIFVAAGIKSQSGAVIAKSEEEAWALFLRTWNESKTWVKTRNGDLVKGIRTI